MDVAASFAGCVLECLQGVGALTVHASEILRGVGQAGYVPGEKRVRDVSTVQFLSVGFSSTDEKLIRQLLMLAKSGDLPDSLSWPPTRLCRTHDSQGWRPARQFKLAAYTALSVLVVLRRPFAGC